MQVPAIDMNKLNAFIGQFVTDLGAAVHSGMVAGRAAFAKLSSMYFS